MRKRSGRPPRFAAVPNETVDDAVNLDFMALALLTVLLRHQDGWEITLAEIGEKYGYGRDALAKAMGLLQVARYVVKVRMMSAEDNQWSTDVIVYDTPASEAEVAELLASTASDPEVRAVQLIEPTETAVELAAKRREKLGPKRRQGPTASVPPRKQAAAGDAAGGSPGPGQAAGQAGAPPRKAGSPTGTAGKRSQAKAPGRRLSREQAAAVRTVEAAFPAELQALLPKYRPEVLRDAIVGALESRSVDDLVERVKRRWWKHGYEADAMPGGKGIGSPVGVAVALVRPSADCPDPMCEDGVTVDRKVPCPTCAVRQQDRKTARGDRVPEQRTDRWECRECRDPARGQRPADGLCASCRAAAQEAAAAARRLQEQFAQAEAVRARTAAEAWEAMLEDAYAEHSRREQLAAELRAQREAAEARRKAEEEETRRIREQIARDHPYLAAVSQT